MTYIFTPTSGERDVSEVYLIIRENDSQNMATVSPFELYDKTIYCTLNLSNIELWTNRKVDGQADSPS